MNIRIAAALLAACAGAAAWAAGAKSTSDLLPPARRQPTVELGARLARPPVPVALPAEIKSPFNPPDFDKPSADEQKTRDKAPDTKGGPAVGGAGGAPGGPKPPAPPGDREMLESLAARIGNTGAIVFGGKTLLSVGKHRLEVGQVFTVTNPANGQDYDLELVAIDRTTFTLRYRGEEITRPHRLTK